jgi:hypothetical protein
LNLLTTVGKKQGSFAIEWIGAPNGSGFEACGVNHTAVAVLVSDAIECAVEFQTFIYIVKEVHLAASLNQVAVTDPNQSDLNASVVELFK